MYDALGFAIGLVLMTVVGHGIWLVCAAVLKAIFGQPGRPGYATGKNCPHCRHPNSVVDGRCLVCGRVPQITPGNQLEQELQGAARHLRRMLDRGILAPPLFEQLMLSLNADLERLRAGGVAGPSQPMTGANPFPVTPALAVPPVSPQASAPTAGVTFLEPVTAEIIDSSPPVAPLAGRAQFPVPQQAPYPVAPREQRAAIQPGNSGASPFGAMGPSAKPVHPLDRPVEPARKPVPPRPPARPLADVLQSFMEESNIRWGEIIAGLLIVGSAVGLVLSLRETLKAIPYFPAILFTSFTVAFFGAGMYTLRRWKLQAISRVILIISLLLVPLSFSAAIVMSGSGDMLRPFTDPLFLTAVVLGTVIFSAVTYTASRELVGEAKWRLTAAVMGTAIAQVVIHRLAKGTLSLGPVTLLAALPLAGFLVATLGQILRLRQAPRLARKRLSQTFLVTGVATFSLVAPLSLLLHETTGRLATLARLTPSLSLAAAALLAIGLVIQRRTVAKVLAPHKTAGTAIAILSGLFMLGMVALAWPKPELLLAVGIVNCVLLTALAIAGNLPLLHAAAIACGTLAATVGFHLLQGRFGLDHVNSLDLIVAASMGRTGLLWTAIAACLGGVGITLYRTTWRDQGLVVLGSAGGLSLLSILVAMICGVTPLGFWGKEIHLDSDLSAPLFLIYAVAFLAVAPLARIPKLPVASFALAGAALLWLGLAQGLTLNETLRIGLERAQLLPARPVFSATLMEAVICIGLALAAAWRWLLASPEDHAKAETTPLWQTFIEPLAMTGAAGILMATPFIFWVWDEQFWWHAGYAGLAAAVWGGVLLVLRKPVVTYAVQAMTAAATALVACAIARGRLTDEFWYLDVRHVHAQFMLIAAAAILWSLLRRTTRSLTTMRSLLVTSYPVLDQVLLAVAVRAAPLLAIFAAWPELETELSLADAPLRPDLLLQMHLAGGWTAWLLVGVVMVALLFSLWEKVSFAALAGVAVTLFAIPWLIATWAEPQHAVGSAARWTTAIFGACGCVVFILRVPLLQQAQRIPGLDWGKLRHKAYYFTAWQPLVFGGVPVLLITIVAVLQQAAGVLLGGPLPETLFAQMPPTASYGIPLLVLVGMLLSYALRERQSLFALGGSMVFQFATNLAFLLYATKDPSVVSDIRWAEWLQWNSIAAGAYGLVWMGLTRWIEPNVFDVEAKHPGKIPLGRASLILQLTASLVTASVLTLWGLAAIFDQPFRLIQEMPVLGCAASYVAVILAAGLLGWYGWRRRKLYVGNIGAVTLLAIVILVSATCDQFDTARNWLAFHVLMAGSLGVAILATVMGLLPTSSFLSTAKQQNPAAPLYFIPSHWTVLAISGLVVVLAIRGGTADPAHPWWSVGVTLGVCLVCMAQGLKRRSQPYAYLSVLLAPLAVILFWVGWPRILGGQHEFVIEAICLALLAPSAIWLTVELQAQKHESRSFDVRFFGPAAHHLGILLGEGLLAIYLVGRLLWEPVWAAPVGAWHFELQDLWTPIALVALVAMLLVALWDRRAFLVLPCLYLWGMIAMSAGLRHAGLPLQEVCLAAALALACHVALTGHLWSFGANLAAMGTRAGISDAVGGLARTNIWLPAASLLLTAVACCTGAAGVLGHEHRDWRVAAALGPGISAWGIGCLAQAGRRDAMQLGALGLAGLTAMFLGWAQLPPQWSDELLLTRAFRLLMVLSAMTFLYGLVLPRYVVTSGSWNTSIRKAGYGGAVLAIITFVGVLVLEVILFVPGQGAPVQLPQVIAVAVVLVALIAGLLSLALLPGKDPLMLSEDGRMFYVYGAQLVAGLLFAHLYICRPYWFDVGLRPYWPYIVLGIAFAGVAVGELFKRQSVRVLAEPFQRMGAFIPIIPAIAMWSVDAPGANYSMVLFLAGVIYLVLNILHQSWVYSAGAAIAGNAALWVLLDDGEFRFADHPQMWLIPPAVSVLIASHLNRQKLDPAMLTTVRYISMIVIYLSSTSEIFLHAAEKSLLPPMILAGIAVAGALAGIVLRIRAFLYLGTTFTLIAMVGMVWNAARKIEQTWPWWVFGITLGIALLILFALFEKKKAELKLLIARLRSWEQ